MHDTYLINFVLYSSIEDKAQEKAAGTTQQAHNHRQHQQDHNASYGNYFTSTHLTNEDKLSMMLRGWKDKTIPKKPTSLKTQLTNASLLLQGFSKSFYQQIGVAVNNLSVLLCLFHPAHSLLNTPVDVHVDDSQTTVGSDEVIVKWQLSWYSPTCGQTSTCSHMTKMHFRKKRDLFSCVIL